LLALGLSSFFVALNHDFHLSKGVVNLVIDAVVTLLTIADRALQRVYVGLLAPVRKLRGSSQSFSICCGGNTVL